MNYNSLYRQWRPKTFDQVIGQDHVIHSLRNQVMNNQVSHAYIFSGTRGTGKTSTAKILAKAVNCLHPVDGNPCMTCENCRDEAFLDIIEMDAASNNSVDDIRDLKEHIKFAPSKGKKKVYIIDEIHMLSQGAFNALLKTLEEPPEYVVFILATTELHKLPATIQSRCQRYEFRRVATAGIFERIKEILDQHHVDFEEEAIRQIIRNSDGAVRDSLSQLEQCLSVSHGTLTEEIVTSTLGIVEREGLLDIIGAILTQDLSAALQLIDSYISEGKDLIQMAKGIIDTLRDLLVILLSGSSGMRLVEGNNEYLTTLKRTAKKTELSQVRWFIDCMIELTKVIKITANKRTMLELYLLKAGMEALPSEARMLKNTAPLGTSVPSNHRKARPQNVPVITEQEETEISVLEVKMSQPRPVITIEYIENKWPQLLDLFSKKDGRIDSVFSGSYPKKLEKNILTIMIDGLEGVNERLLQTEEIKQHIEQSIHSFFGESLRCVYINNDDKEKERANQRKQIREQFSDAQKVKITEG